MAQVRVSTTTHDALMELAREMSVKAKRTVSADEVIVEALRFANIHLRQGSR